MERTTIIQCNREDLFELVAEAFEKGYKKAIEESKQPTTARNKKEMASKLNISVYKVNEMLKYGQIKRTIQGLTTK